MPSPYCRISRADFAAVFALANPRRAVQCSGKSTRSFYAQNKTNPTIKPNRREFLKQQNSI